MNQQDNKPAPQRRFFGRVFGKDGGTAKHNPELAENAPLTTAQIPAPDVVPTPQPELPPSMPPQPELPDLPGPGPDVEPEFPGIPQPDVIPPAAPPGPEMPPPTLPEPELPTPGQDEPDITPPGPDVIPPPGPPLDPSTPAHAAVVGAAPHPGDVTSSSAVVDNEAIGGTADERAGWISRLRQGLSRSSSRLSQGIAGVFTKRKLDDSALEDLEDLLITADLGVETSRKLCQALSRTRFNQEVTANDVRGALADEITRILEPAASTISIHEAFRPHVILVCGVNGSGKTTTIAKMARLFKQVGFVVMLAAGDTFRAAAIEQLQVWGDRIGCRVIAREPGADAASLAFEAYEQAKAAGVHVLIIDTAGRLHNKSHLMAELQKMARVLTKIDERAPHDTILVLDATVGQNAHQQVDVFRQMVDVTGLVVTKLDGSAKGGVVVALAERFDLPVYFVGVGEGMDDMRAFEARAFARMLLGLED